jgi:serpin B
MAAAMTCLSLAACAVLALSLTAFSGAAGTRTPKRGPKVTLAVPRTKHALPPIDSAGPSSPGERFGLDLLSAQHGNAVVSPASVAAALAMAGTGARGTTAEQIAVTLGLKGPTAFNSVGKQQAALIREQTAASGDSPEAPDLEIADGLFVQQGFPLSPAFVSGLQSHFGATPEALDLSGDPAGSLRAINAWGADHTNGIIPEMLSELPAEARLVLANAVYLKARWEKEFEAEENFPGTFHRANGKGVSTEFMHQTDKFRYTAGPGYKAVELPYRDSTLSLLAVLGGIVGDLKPETVMLSLPRFHLHTEAELQEPLESLGMTVPFTEAADFSGITSAESLMIGAIEHVADIEVDEEGTEAAATTGVVMVPTSAQAPPIDSVTFNADRPFLFFVRDDKSGAILFAGRLADPSIVAPG